jgi:malate permease and related proteins
VNEIILVILKALPIILTLLLGVWIKKIGFVSIDAISGMKKLTLNISLPCVLFLTFFEAEMKPEVLILSVVIFAACILEFGLGFLIKKLQTSSNQFYPSLFTTYLTGPIGYPLFIAFFGAGNLYKLAILDVGNSIFIFTVLTAFLSTVSCSINSTKKKSVSAHMKNLIKSPLAVSMFLGIIISLTGYNSMIEKNPAAAALLEAVSFMASAAFPLILIIIGYELPFDFKNFRKISTAVLIRLAMMLSIAYVLNTFVIVRWLGLDEIYQAALYTMFILPPPFIIPLSIIGECEHKQYVLDFISLHLLVSLIAFVILMYLI